MTIEEAIRARIAGLAAVQSIVGTRVYLDKTPQDPTYPLVLVYLAGDHVGQHMRGSDGLGYARVTAEARAHEESGEDAYQVSALFQAFDGDGRGPGATGIFGWSGFIGSPPLEICNCAHRGTRDRYYDAASERRVLRMTQDYWVTYRVAMT